jgi:hypothetical protein
MVLLFLLKQKLIIKENISGINDVFSIGSKDQNPPQPMVLYAQREPNITPINNVTKPSLLNWNKEFLKNSKSFFIRFGLINKQIISANGINKNENPRKMNGG